MTKGNATRKELLTLELKKRIRKSERKPLGQPLRGKVKGA